MVERRSSRGIRWRMAKRSSEGRWSQGNLVGGGGAVDGMASCKGRGRGGNSFVVVFSSSVQREAQSTAARTSPQRNAQMLPAGTLFSAMQKGECILSVAQSQAGLMFALPEWRPSIGVQRNVRQSRAPFSGYLAPIFHNYLPLVPCRQAAGRDIVFSASTAPFREPTVALASHWLRCFSDPRLNANYPGTRYCDCILHVQCCTAVRRVHRQTANKRFPPPP